MWRILPGIPLSLLPLAYRRRWLGRADVDLNRGAFVCGALQMTSCLLLFIFGYIAFLDQMARSMAAAAMAHGQEGALASELVQYGIGMVSLLQYLIHPKSILLAYFGLEGLLRVFAQVITGEVVGTLPLAIVAAIHLRLDAEFRERAMGPRVPDEVEFKEGKYHELRIASCRPKEWNKLMTISYNNAFYEVSAQRHGHPPRPFVYLLRRHPEGKIVRGIHAYHPDEALVRRKA